MTSIVELKQQDDFPLSSRGLVKAQILKVVSSSSIVSELQKPQNDGVDSKQHQLWNHVNELLRQLHEISLDLSSTYDSCEDDPMGRLFLSKLIEKNPPAPTVGMALNVFPNALCHNPAAFFTACRYASSDVTVIMMRHIIKTTNNNECPYPWVMSDCISLDGAKALIETYPRGVLEESPLLSGYNLLDYFLMSDEMVSQRKFNVTLWSKFKLILLAAQYSQGEEAMSPVQTFLRRVFSRPELFTNPGKAHHILWLLHQLRFTDKWVFEKKSQDGMYPVMSVLSQRCCVQHDGLSVAREIIKLLLATYPVSAKQCFNGRSTLHLAVANGWPCHDLLLSIYPEALDIQDPATGLVPFQIAATAKSEQSEPSAVVSSSCSLDVTYELFRANPSHAKIMQNETRQRNGPTRVGA